MCGNVPKSNVITEILILAIKIISVLIKNAIRLVWPQLEKQIEGEVVLITGTAHGIGKELAIQFAELGARVICWDVDSTGNLKTVLHIVDKGFEAHGYTCDISDRDQVIEMSKDVKRDVGDVTIIVNNAGVLTSRPLQEHSHLEIWKMFDVNILSHFWVLEAFLPDMLKMKKGHVVAVSSMCGIAGVENMAPYSATKFAIRGLMEALSEEVRLSGLQRNIHFTSVYPFYVDTNMAPDPEYRFPFIFSAVSPQSAAKKIVKAVRQNCSEISIPASLLLSTNIIRIFPQEVRQVIMDFLSKRNVKMTRTEDIVN